MALYAEVELAQLVVAETVSPELHEQCMRTVLPHHSGHHVLQ